MNTFITQVKREFWECRTSFIRVPLFMALILSALLLLTIVPLQDKIGWFMKYQERSTQIDTELSESQEQTESPRFSASPEKIREGLTKVYGLFILVLLFVIVSYFGDSLLADRRDRSVLFWKSMPVSESQQVFAKLAAGLIGAPAFYLLAAMATGAFFLTVFSFFVGVVWNLQLPGVGAVIGGFLSSAVGLLLAWVLMAIWLLPIFSWLLLCSAFARKSPLLLAIAIPLALMVMEVWILDTGFVKSVLSQWLSEVAMAYHGVVGNPAEVGAFLLRALTAPVLWLGVVLSGLMLAASIWLRIYRWEI